MSGFLSRNRLPENIRSKLDIGYKIDDQSILIMEIRPNWMNPVENMEYPMAKAIYIKSKDHWKIFWMHANGNWYPYQTYPIAKNLHDFY